MNQTIQIETGAQLLARLTNRPSLRGLENVLFSDGPRYNEIIEVSGNSSSGKTLLLTQLIAKCILPRRYKDIQLNGSGAGVILVNTDHHFHISVLINSMAYIIRGSRSTTELSAKVFSDEIVRHIIEDSLNYLTVINCYESGQFFLSLQSLQTILSNDEKTAMIAVDSMSAYYWQDRENGGVWSMDEYLKNFLKLIRKHISHHNVVLTYTKSSDFGSREKGTADSALVSEEKIDYKVQLHRWEETNEFSAVVKSITDKKTLGYTITDNGIEWKTIGSRN